MYYFRLCWKYLKMSANRPTPSKLSSKYKKLVREARKVSCVVQRQLLIFLLRIVLCNITGATASKKMFNYRT